MLLYFRFHSINLFLRGDLTQYIIMQIWLTLVQFEVQGEVQCHAIFPKQLYCLNTIMPMVSDKQSGSPRPLLGTLKMGRVRTILTHTYPYPHEHSRHIMTAVIIACLFFISSDNMHTLIHKLDKNIKWWSMYVCLIGFFYFFSSPFLGRTIQPSYSNFNRWYAFGFQTFSQALC